MESRENPQLQRKPTQHIGIGLLELRMQKHLVLQHVFREMMGVWSMPNPFVDFLRRPLQNTSNSRCAIIPDSEQTAAGHR
jgi:hypothetical protein